MAAAALNAASPGPGALLLQLDVDELWTADAPAPALRLLGDSDLTRAYFHCHFLVGPKLATATPRGYGHSDAYEWLRLWRADPDDVFWASHAPPPRRAADRARLGAASRRAVAFKERFYGAPAPSTAGGGSRQRAPVRFADYLPWVRDEPRFRATVADAVPFAAAAVLGVSTRAVAAAEAPPAPVVNAELPASLAALHRRAAPPFPDDHDHVADALSLAWLCEGSQRSRPRVPQRPDGRLWAGRVVLLVHDLTPEKFAWPRSPYWDLKRSAIEQPTRF
ncbi:glycosyl transferase [Aureococcus anophagefferens]|uniref:Glycosyl transferase n=1 Tax=Aureococcus anophagefferens TaxID=44056 RepID=A0ABR1G386_AURAN